MTRLPWLGEWSTPEMVSGCLRPLFLETLARLAPAVLLALRDEVLPVYQRSWGPTLETPAPSSRGKEISGAGASVPAWFEEDRPPTVLRTIRYDRDPAAGRVHFTEEEASALHSQGHELLMDPNQPGPERYYLWQPSRAQGGADDVPILRGMSFANLEYEPMLAGLRQALLSWGESFHLGKEWILDAALDQLDAWDRHLSHAYPFCGWPRREGQPSSAAALSAWLARFNEQIRAAAGCHRGPEELEGPVALGWLALPAFAWFSPIREEDRRLAFEHPGWDPAMRERARARSQILGEFTRYLDVYLDHLEDRLSHDREPWQRTPNSRVLGQYVEWLVRYQCRGESFPDIDRAATGYKHASGETVEKPVRRLAKLVDIQLRPGTRGRPPGSKNRPKRRSRR